MSMNCITNYTIAIQHVEGEKEEITELLQKLLSTIEHTPFQLLQFVETKPIEVLTADQRTMMEAIFRMYAANTSATIEEYEFTALSKHTKEVEVMKMELQIIEELLKILL
jgi:hypothetical protein